MPFCASICHYCNFNRGLFDPALKDRYVAAVLGDVRRAGDAAACRGLPAAADTVFFGGGTPSLLDPAEVGAIVAACRGSFALHPDAEITIEANPETVSVSSLAALRHVGVNRVSFGVQSFRDDELVRLGRIHDSVRARRAVADARAAGFENLSLDLMMWLPGQRVEDWDMSLEALVALEPEHASLYMLELYPNAPLREEMARAGWSLAPDDDAAAMYERAMDRLEAAGYEQYEISNVAKPGRQSRHNVKYWTDGEWLGFGPGAHSTRQGERWKNVSATVEYVARVESGADVTVERRVLSADDRWREAVMMGLRMNAGVSLDGLRREFGVDLLAQYGHHLHSCSDAGLVVEEAGRLRLTRRGMLMANEVLAVLF
ncbi:MAG: radical SAM family heme chaperone HemW [Vicinamibacterales bacterium]|nr:radical SAM family heme chaperone HemW [Vicinamibacterales bacterium]